MEDGLILEDHSGELVLEEGEDTTFELVIEDDKVEIISEVQQGPVGPPGAQGDPGIGEPGPPGPPGDPGVVSYTHTQAVPEAVWVINHPLAYEPAVTTLDTAGRVWEGDITYALGVVTVTFDYAFAGKAILS